MANPTPPNLLNGAVHKNRLPYGFFKKASKGMIDACYSWKAMNGRVRNVNSKNYDGMYIDPKWIKDFFEFYKDMGDRPEGFSLDRIDPNQGYFKENCRWADANQQANNKKKTVYIEYNGERLSASQWGKKLGGSDDLVYNRLKYGWSLDKALTTGVHHA